MPIPAASNAGSGTSRARPAMRGTADPRALEFTAPPSVGHVRGPAISVSACPLWPHLPGNYRCEQGSSLHQPDSRTARMRGAHVPRVAAQTWIFEGAPTVRTTNDWQSSWGGWGRNSLCRRSPVGREEIVAVRRAPPKRLESGVLGLVEHRPPSMERVAIWRESGLEVEERIVCGADPPTKV